MNHSNYKQRGVTLVEVMIALSIIASIAVVIGFSVTAYVDARTKLLNDTKSLYLAEEGYEVLRALRDNDWDTIDVLAIGSTHYLDVSTSTIAVSATPEIIDGLFYRSFVLSAVYRNSNDDITSSTASGAIVDTEILEVRMSVFGPTGTTSLTALLSNIHAI